MTAVGAGVDGFRPGDAVVFFGASGAYATDVVVSAARVHLRPPQVSAAEGAALGIPVGTAYQALRSLGVGPGDTLLVHGGSGAVGQAAIQFAVLWGATVIATSSERRADRVRALGATPVAYGEGLADRVRAAAPQGVTVAIDAAGHGRGAADLARPRRRPRPHRDPRARAGCRIPRHPRVLGGGPHAAHRRSSWHGAREAVPVALALLAAGRFSIELGPSFPLADAAEAHRVVEAGVDGKVTLVPVARSAAARAATVRHTTSRAAIGRARQWTHARVPAFLRDDAGAGGVPARCRREHRRARRSTSRTPSSSPR